MRKGGDGPALASTTIELQEAMAAAAALIHQANRIYVVTHRSPDGDAIGSLLGMGWMLQALEKPATLACADRVPENLAFLPGSHRVVARSPIDEDLVIVVDSGSLDHLGTVYDEAAFRGKKLLVIDHHASNSGFADVNVVDPQAAATAELIFELLHVLGVPLDKRIATCLLTGIAADTRGFQTSSTTVRSVELAAELMKAGAALPEILWHVFSDRSFTTLCLWGKVLSAVRRTGRVAWSVVTQEMLRECGATLQELGDLVNLLVTRDTDVGILFKETSDGAIRVSLRATTGIDVSSVASRFGGGGHPQAAGFTVEGPLREAEQKVLEAVTRLLDGYNKT
jgi:phosphoesterase RecJ-like protein